MDWLHSVCWVSRLNVYLRRWRLRSHLNPWLDAEAPEDPGCSRCCIATIDSCTVKSWTSHENSGIVTPWYNSIASEKECPSDCAMCASCSQRGETELRALLTARPKDCDCAKVAMGIDPRFAPMSCPCYCSRWETLRTQCPYQLVGVSRSPSWRVHCGSSI